MQTLARDKKQVMVTIVLSLVFIVGFMALDLRLLQSGNALQISIASRCVVVIVSLWALWMVHHLTSIRLFDRVVFMAMAVVLCHVLVVNLLRPADYVPVTV
jgi:hypothetical protein